MQVFRSFKIEIIESTASNVYLNHDWNYNISREIWMFDLFSDNLL